MTPEEYAAAQALISAAVARYTLQLSKLFIRPALSVVQWLGMLELLWPEVQRQREESAALARRFYDSQRQFHHPAIERNDRPLEGSLFRKFVKNMDPARQRMSQMDSPQDAATMLALRAVREVENAGRQQIIHAVKNDPEPRIVKGWARVATGRETCAWCLMLISRGPVYAEANTAGLDLDDESAIELFEAAGQDLQSFYDHIKENNFMEEWHTGCDCKVVPVFDVENWFGKDAQLRALELWKDASQEAEDLIESGEARSTNKNNEALNALRRRLYRGDVRMTEFAALAA